MHRLSSNAWSPPSILRLRHLSPASNRRVLIIVLGCCTTIAFAIAPGKEEFPLALFSLVLFWVAQFISQESVSTPTLLLCPRNVAQFLFLLQLVIIPLVIVYSGFSNGSLEYLPSIEASNAGLLLSFGAFIAFKGGYGWKVSKLGRSSHATPKGIVPKPIYPRHSETLLILYLALGLLGYYFLFPSMTAYIYYVGNPTVFDQSVPGEATLQGAASTFLRPFLSYFVVLYWARWVDRSPIRGSLGMSIFLTMAAILFLILLNITYSFNRGSVVGPIAAIGAAFSARVRRIPYFILLLFGALIFLGSLLMGEYRANRPSYYATTAQELGETIDLSRWVQVYGSAPQFSGFLIESLGYGSDLKWGSTLVSSILSPVPILGKVFRESSGARLYNRLIYGSRPSADQVVPFGAEVFVNFHLVGVLAAFFALGICVAWLQARFEGAKNTFEAYFYFLISIWVSFLVIGSAAVTSQIFIYFFWPVVAYAVLRRFSKSSCRGGMLWS